MRKGKDYFVILKKYGIYRRRIPYTIQNTGIPRIVVVYRIQSIILCVYVIRIIKM
jgi:hypothetical protein